MGRIAVYVLLCGNERYYVGSTNDLERRLSQHREGKVKATGYIQPIVLKAFIDFEILTEARRFEFEVKRKKSRTYVEQLISLYPAQR